MAKQRKTKKEKARTAQKKTEIQGFVVNEEWLKARGNKQMAESTPVERKFFRADLTKTLILTMLVLALELAIWSYLSRH